MVIRSTKQLIDFFETYNYLLYRLIDENYGRKSVSRWLQSDIIYAIRLLGHSPLFTS